MLVERAGFALRASFEVAASEVLAVVGPNGAGKTTMLRALAGLEPLTSGELDLGGRVVDDGSVFVPPHRRRVGYVSQDAQPFPFATVLDNVAFGPRHAGRSRREARRVARAYLATVGLGELASCPAASLSGGQARRVVIARALAGGPALLLLDEPFAGLDAVAVRETREAMRAAIQAHRCATVMVTHDAAEAFTLADRFLVLEGGAVTQVGTGDELRREPRSPYAADFVGLNVLRGRVDGDRIVVGPEVSVAAADPPAGGGDVVVVIHPRAVTLHRRTPEGSARNTWRGTVAAIAFDAGRVRVTVDGPLPLVADVTTEAVRELGLEPGCVVYAAVKASEVIVDPG